MATGCSPVVPTAFSVGSGVGTMTMGAAGATRTAVLDGVSTTQGDTVVTVRPQKLGNRRRDLRQHHGALGRGHRQLPRAADSQERRKVATQHGEGRRRLDHAGRLPIRPGAPPTRRDAVSFRFRVTGVRPPRWKHGRGGRTRRSRRPGRPQQPTARPAGRRRGRWGWSARCPAPPRTRRSQRGLRRLHVTAAPADQPPGRPDRAGDPVVRSGRPRRLVTNPLPPLRGHNGGSRVASRRRSPPWV